MLPSISRERHSKSDGYMRISDCACRLTNHIVTLCSRQHQIRVCAPRTTKGSSWVKGQQQCALMAVHCCGVDCMKVREDE